MWRAARRRTRAPADEHRIGSRQTRQTAADPRLGARSSAVEHLTFNQVVVGSIPTGLTIKINMFSIRTASIMRLPGTFPVRRPQRRDLVDSTLLTGEGI